MYCILTRFSFDPRVVETIREVSLSLSRHSISLRPIVREDVATTLIPNFALAQPTQQLISIPTTTSAHRSPPCARSTPLRKRGENLNQQFIPPLQFSLHLPHHFLLPSLPLLSYSLYRILAISFGGTARIDDKFPKTKYEMKYSVNNFYEASLVLLEKEAGGESF